MIAACPTHALMDLLASPAAERLPAETLRRAADALKNEQIERFEYPSPTPGVSGGRKGASPKQLDVQRRFFSRRFRVVACGGGNQSGKTECVGGLCFCKWIRDRAQDGDVYWIVAQRTEDLRNVPAKTLWTFLPRSMFPAGIEYHPRHGFGQIPTLAMSLPDGRGTAEVWFRSEEMELNVFESARTNGVWWTECSRESIFDALQPRLAARGGFLLMDYVPREAWHRLRIQSGENPYIYFTRFSMSDNAHNLAPGEIEYQRTILTPEEAAVRIDGKDGAAFGVVVKEFSDRNVLDTFPVPAEWPCWLYTDVGKYTASLLCTVDPKRGMVAADEAYSLGLTVEENAAEVVRMLERHGRKPDKVAEFRMDPAAWAFTSANQATVGEQYQRHGLPYGGWTRTATVGESAMLDRMRQAFMHNTLMVSRSCPKLIMELQTWRHKTDRDGKVDPNDRYEGPNHAIDALKAWVWTEPTFEQPILAPIDAPDPVAGTPAMDWSQVLGKQED